MGIKPELSESYLCMKHSRHEKKEVQDGKKEKAYILDLEDEVVQDVCTHSINPSKV